MIFAVCAYFAFALVGEQELNHKDGKLPADQFFFIFNPNPGKFQHTVFPIFLFLKFIFFNGWMGVALALDDPWEGVDKEDFKVVLKENFLNLSKIFSPRSRSWCSVTFGRSAEVSARKRRIFCGRS